MVVLGGTWYFSSLSSRPFSLLKSLHRKNVFRVDNVWLAEAGVIPPLLLSSQNPRTNGSTFSREADEFFRAQSRVFTKLAYIPAIESSRIDTPGPVKLQMIQHVLNARQVTFPVIFQPKK